MSYTPHSSSRPSAPRSEGAAASQKSAQILSRNPEKAMQEMMETIDRVRNVYERETDILKRSDMPGFVRLQDEKFIVSQEFQNGVEQMLARKNEMKTVNPLLRKRMAAAQKEFSALAEKNMEALDRMKRSMDSLGSKIRNVAKEEVQKQRAFSYGESGTIHRDDRRAISTGITETA